MQELKLSLKNVSGIYKFTHRETGRNYVGSSVDIGYRFYRHIYDSLNVIKGTYFGRALKLYGAESFDFEVIEKCPKEQLLVREKHYMGIFNAVYPAGFNTYKDPTATYGKITSEETRERIRRTKVGKKHTPEHCAKIAAAGRLRKGKNSPETTAKKRAIFARFKHVICSPEARAKQAAALRGRRPSEATRQKLRESQRIRREREVITPEFREKCRIANVGVKRSPEAVANMRRLRELRKLNSAGVSVSTILDPEPKSPDQLHPV